MATHYNKHYVVLKYTSQSPNYVMACSMGDRLYTLASIYAEKFTKTEAENLRDKLTTDSKTKHYMKFIL